MKQKLETQQPGVVFLNASGNMWPIRDILLLYKLFSGYYFIICDHTYCFLWKFDVNWLSMCIYGQPKFGYSTLRAMWVYTL